MMQKITPKQKRFADAYMDTGNATEAASRAYRPKSRAVARSMGSENLTKPDIRAYLDGMAQDAAAMVHGLSQHAKSESVRLAACRDILDRAGHFVDKTKHPEQPEAITIRWADREEKPIVDTA